ncbi:MAG TPA: alpha/beta fold hydrolase [Thermoanaerobaculia bacterium]|nr:alpha/beta fold hydrolase [Thermoanaerobaculia bacterium]
MKKLVLAVLFVLLVLFSYFRPLTLAFAARDLYLVAIGMKSEFVQVGPHRIHYWTKGEGPPLLLVHGVAMRAADLAPFFSALSRRHRVYAPDLLGFGESDAPPGADYSVATQAAVVRGFMDAVHLQQPDVAGLSMGGWIALSLAAEHPKRVKRLALLSSAGLGHQSALTENSFSATTVAEQRRSFALQSDLLPKLPDFILRDFIRHSKQKREIVRASMRSMLTRPDLLMDRKLARVRMPVLILHGTSDRIVPFPVALRMKQQLPQARLVPLHGCGHLAMAECGGRAMPALLEFLR